VNAKVKNSSKTVGKCNAVKLTLSAFSTTSEILLNFQLHRAIATAQLKNANSMQGQYNEHASGQNESTS